MWYHIRERIYPPRNRNNNNSSESSSDPSRNAPKNNNYNNNGSGSANANAMPIDRNTNRPGSAKAIPVNQNAPENINGPAIPSGSDALLRATPEVPKQPRKPLPGDPNLPKILNSQRTPGSLEHLFDPFHFYPHSAASAETVIMPHAVDVPLSREDCLIIKKMPELSTESRAGVESQKQFYIFNLSGRALYEVSKTSGAGSLFCCKPSRPFEMTIGDKFGNELVHLRRPRGCRLIGCRPTCFPWCRQTLHVFDPATESFIGTIQQQWSPSSSPFVIRNVWNKPLLRIEGDGRDHFKVMDTDGVVKIGSIVNGWSRLGIEMPAGNDGFCVTFPEGLDVKLKILILGASFLIDVTFFQSSPKGQLDRSNMSQDSF